MINPKLHRYAQKLDPTQNYLVTEFVDNYEDGVMGRRDLLERVYRITGSAAAAGTLLALGVKPLLAAPEPSAAAAPAQQAVSPLSVAENDPAIVAGPVTFPSGGATIQAYWARPVTAGRHPAILIAHENTGISDHFRDVARRFAKAGYVGIILDLLSRQGGTAAVPTNEIGGIISGPGAADQWVNDYRAAMAFLRQQSFVDPNRMGITGFCFGGSVTLNVASREPTLRAAVPFYGTPGFPDELRNTRAAVLGVYGETDARVNMSIPTVEQSLQAARVPFRANIYPGAGHAFFNDTRANVYNEEASTAAWRDTLAWFNTYVRGASTLPATGGGSSTAEGVQDLPIAE